MGVRLKGELLIQSRNKKGISDEEAARAFQLHITKYRTLEESISEATLEQAVAIADYYGLSVDTLIGRNAPTIDLLEIIREQPTVQGRALTPHEQSLIEQFIRNTTGQTQKLLDFADWIRSDEAFLKKLQELKIVNAKADQEQILHSIDKLLA